MSGEFVPVSIHESQFPDRVWADLRESLKSGKLNHKFLYDGWRQTRRWLALHEAHSPARRDPSTLQIYNEGFHWARAHLPGSELMVIGLGAGGGQKDASLLQLLSKSGVRVQYAPVDVTPAMVLTARQTVFSVVGEVPCYPMVLDLASVKSQELLEWTPGNSARLITFFGMIPNFEPDEILPRLAALVRPGDVLLFSANLAPGSDYEQGIQRVLPQYQNELTREWLAGFLMDIGIEANWGRILFSVTGDRLKRIEANLYFDRSCSISLQGEAFTFNAGQALRLFFSYRYTPRLLTSLLATHGFEVAAQWIASNEEEGVFAITKATPTESMPDRLRSPLL